VVGVISVSLQLRIFFDVEAIICIIGWGDGQKYNYKYNPMNFAILDNKS